jgi:hypothetical protein
MLLLVIPFVYAVVDQGTIRTAMQAYSAYFGSSIPSALVQGGGSSACSLSQTNNPPSYSSGGSCGYLLGSTSYNQCYGSMPERAAEEIPCPKLFPSSLTAAADQSAASGSYIGGCPYAQGSGYACQPSSRGLSGIPSQALLTGGSKYSTSCALDGSSGSGRGSGYACQQPSRGFAGVPTQTYSGAPTSTRACAMPSARMQSASCFY